MTTTMGRLRRAVRAARPVRMSALDIHPLLSAVHANPLDIATSLILADAFHEAGRPAHARHIREAVAAEPPRGPTPLRVYERWRETHPDRYALPLWMTEHPGEFVVQGHRNHLNLHTGVPNLLTRRGTVRRRGWEPSHISWHLEVPGGPEEAAARLAELEAEGAKVLDSSGVFHIRGWPNPGDVTRLARDGHPARLSRSDLPGLIAAAHESPDDQAPRLILADALHESGHTAGADAIRRALGHQPDPMRMIWPHHATRINPYTAASPQEVVMHKDGIRYALQGVVSTQASPETQAAVPASRLGRRKGLRVHLSGETSPGWWRSIAAHSTHDPELILRLLQELGPPAYGNVQPYRRLHWWLWPMFHENAHLEAYPKLAPQPYGRRPPEKLMMRDRVRRAVRMSMPMWSREMADALEANPLDGGAWQVMADHFHENGKPWTAEALRLLGRHGGEYYAMTDRQPPAAPHPGDGSIQWADPIGASSVLGDTDWAGEHYRLGPFQAGMYVGDHNGWLHIWHQHPDGQRHRDIGIVSLPAEVAHGVLHELEPASAGNEWATGRLGELRQKYPAPPARLGRGGGRPPARMMAVPYGGDDFFRKVMDNPHDEASRLVLADWLQEHDDPRHLILRGHDPALEGSSYYDRAPGMPKPFSHETEAGEWPMVDSLMIWPHEDRPGMVNVQWWPYIHGEDRPSRHPKWLATLHPADALDIVRHQTAIRGDERITNPEASEAGTKWLEEWAHRHPRPMARAGEPVRLAATHELLAHAVASSPHAREALSLDLHAGHRLPAIADLLTRTPQPGPAPDDLHTLGSTAVRGGPRVPLTVGFHYHGQGRYRVSLAGPTGFLGHHWVDKGTARKAWEEFAPHVRDIPHRQAPTDTLRWHGEEDHQRLLQHLGVGEVGDHPPVRAVIQHLGVPPRPPAPPGVHQDDVKTNPQVIRPASGNSWERLSMANRLRRVVRMARQDTPALYERVAESPFDYARWGVLADSLDEGGAPAWAEAARTIFAHPDMGREQNRWWPAGIHPTLEYGRSLHGHFGAGTIFGTVHGIPVNIGHTNVGGRPTAVRVYFTHEPHRGSKGLAYLPLDRMESLVREMDSRRTKPEEADTRLADGTPTAADIARRIDEERRAYGPERMAKSPLDEKVYDPWIKQVVRDNLARKFGTIPAAARAGVDQIMQTPLTRWAVKKAGSAEKAQDFFHGIADPAHPLWAHYDPKKHPDFAQRFFGYMKAAAYPEHNEYTRGKLVHASVIEGDPEEGRSLENFGQVTSADIPRQESGLTPLRKAVAYIRQNVEEHPDRVLRHIVERPGIAQGALAGRTSLTGELVRAAAQKLVQAGKVTAVRIPTATSFRTEYYPAGHPAIPQVAPTRMEVLAGHLKNGLTLPQAAAAMGVTQAAAHDSYLRAKKAGVLEASFTPTVAPRSVAKASLEDIAGHAMAGLSNAQIAAKVGLSESHVGHRVAAAIARGLLEKGGRVYRPQPKAGSVASQIVAMAQKGRPNTEIASALGVPTKRVSWEIVRARRAGRLSRDGKPARLLAQKDRPVDVAGAGQRAASSNHADLLGALKGVLDKSGLVPHKIYPAVHDAGGQARASAVAAVFGERHPQAADYGAAWQGLLAKQPALVVFRSHPQGADSVYRFGFKGPQAAMSQLLDGIGVSNRVYVTHGGGTHVFLYDRGRRLRDAVGQLAARLGLEVTEHLGDGHPVGGGDDVGRAAYRDEIRSAERQERGGKSVRMGREDVPALWAALVNNPQDRARWLIAADALEEIGKPHTAMLLRDLAGRSSAWMITRPRHPDEANEPAGFRHFIEPKAGAGQLTGRVGRVAIAGANFHVEPRERGGWFSVQAQADPNHLHQIGSAWVSPERTSLILGEADSRVGGQEMPGDSWDRLARWGRPVRLALDPAFVAGLASAPPGDTAPWLVFADHLRDEGFHGLAAAINHGRFLMPASSGSGHLDSYDLQMMDRHSDITNPREVWTAHMTPHVGHLADTSLSAFLDYNHRHKTGRLWLGAWATPNLDAPLPFYRDNNYQFIHLEPDLAHAVAADMERWHSAPREPGSTEQRNPFQGRQAAAIRQDLEGAGHTGEKYRMRRAGRAVKMSRHATADELGMWARALHEHGPSYDFPTPEYMGALGAFADHMDEIGDPRAFIVRGHYDRHRRELDSGVTWPGLVGSSHWQQRYLPGSRHLADSPRHMTSNDYRTYRLYGTALPDGGFVNWTVYSRPGRGKYANRPGPVMVHWAHPTGRGGEHVSLYTMTTPAQLRDMARRLGVEQRLLQQQDGPWYRTFDQLYPPPAEPDRLTRAGAPVRLALDPAIVRGLQAAPAGDRAPWLVFADHLHEDGMPALAHALRTGRPLAHGEFWHAPIGSWERPDHIEAGGFPVWQSHVPDHKGTKMYVGMEYAPEHRAARVWVKPYLSDERIGQAPEHAIWLTDPALVHAVAAEQERLVREGGEPDWANEFSDIRQHLEGQGVRSDHLQLARGGKVVKMAMSPELIAHLAHSPVEDEAPWLVWADHLDEEGYPALAHVVRHGRRLDPNKYHDFTPYVPGTEPGDPGRVVPHNFNAAEYLVPQGGEYTSAGPGLYGHMRYYPDHRQAQLVLIQEVGHQGTHKERFKHLLVEDQALAAGAAEDMGRMAKAHKAPYNQSYAGEGMDDLARMIRSHAGRARLARDGGPTPVASTWIASLEDEGPAGVGMTTRAGKSYTVARAAGKFREWMAARSKGKKFNQAFRTPRKHGRVDSKKPDGYHSFAPAKETAMTATEPVRLSADPSVPLAEWERGPAWYAMITGPTWRGGWRVRDISDGVLIRRAIELGSLAALTGEPRFDAWHGGTVNNSYGYRAATGGAVLVGLPSGHVVARRQQELMRANGATATGVASRLMPAAADIFHGRAGEPRRQAAMVEAARIAEAEVVGGRHLLTVRLHPAFRHPEFRQLYSMYRENPQDAGRRGVIKDWLMDHMVPDADRIDPSKYLSDEVGRLATPKHPEQADARTS
jgi:uncharacterized protein (TIGR02996 family)